MTKPLFHPYYPKRAAMIELNEIYEDIWTTLPDTQNDEPPFYKLSQDTLAVPPEKLRTKDLCMTINTRFYNDFPVDAVAMEADRKTLGKLGLLLFASVFHPLPTRTTLELTHYRSQIRYLHIGYDWTKNNDRPGLNQIPLNFNYYPKPVRRHPWHDDKLNIYDLPVLSLTNQQEMILTKSDLKNRNTAVGFGHVDANCRFAELLLNASRASNTKLEFNLESDGPFRGLGPYSSEINIYLPGSLGNLDHTPVLDTEPTYSI